LVLPDSDAWEEWVAHNLAFDVLEGELIAELVKAGYLPKAAKELIDETRTSPAFRAAQRIARELRKWTTLSEVLLDLEGEVYDFTRIPRVSGLSEEAFLGDYYSTNRPVIIEDVVREWPACSKWTPRYLRDAFGSEVVRYQRRNGNDHRDAFVDHARSAPLLS